MLTDRTLRQRLMVAVVGVATMAGAVGCTIPTAKDRAASLSPTPAPATTRTPATTTRIVPTPPPPIPPPPSPTVTPALPTTPAGACRTDGTALDCDLQQRISAANSYIAQRPGTVGYVLRDRVTGASYRNDQSGTMVWTASTIKLAMVVDLFTRDRRRAITLTDDDKNLIAQMLHSSDNEAADTLWFRYWGTDHFDYNNDFASYGMTDLTPMQGFSDDYPYWGFQQCTPEDLDRLIQYVLDRLDPPDRAYIVGQLQQVDANQQWGVWAAGPRARPGNKDGWSEEQSGWVINSVGFAGPNQRYTLAIMNSLNGEGDYDDGVETDSHVAQLLLAGRAD